MHSDDVTVICDYDRGRTLILTDSRESKKKSKKREISKSKSFSKYSEHFEVCVEQILKWEETGRAILFVSFFLYSQEYKVNDQILSLLDKNAKKC